MRIQVSGTTPGTITLEGNGAKQSAIRTMPGCTSGAVGYATLYVDGGFAVDQKSANRIEIRNFKIDSWCTSRFTVAVNYAVGMTHRGNVLRNAKAGNGANFYQFFGYETSIDGSNRLENINDPGHACYATAADPPDYNLWTDATDGVFGAMAVNARVANFYQAKGGNNHFIATHGWGYPGGTDGQPNLRGQYNYLMNGNAVLMGTIGDQPTVAGIRLTNTINDNSGSVVTGHTITGLVEASVAGISIGNNVNHTTIVANNLTYTATNRGIVADSAFAYDASSNIIHSNTNSTITTSLFLGGTSNQTLTLAPSPDRIYVSALNQTGSASDPSALQFTANGASGFMNWSINSKVWFQLLNTGFYIDAGGGLQLVSRGAPDSGGTGFRILRVPN